MAPKKKQRVQVLEGGLSASEGQENRSSARVPPVSILKDVVASFPSVKSLPRKEELNLRRQTYFIHGADASEENEPCVIHADQVKTSSTVDDKIRRLTYIVPPVPHGHAESLLINCNPGIEMNHSELEIAGIQMQPSTVQESKSKKRVGKKKKSIQALQEDSKVMESENTDPKKENESLISNAPAGGKPRKRGQKKSANSNDAQVKSQESENGTEISTVKAKGRRKKELIARPVQPLITSPTTKNSPDLPLKGQEFETIPTGSNVQKKAVKRGKKKNAD